VTNRPSRTLRPLRSLIPAPSIAAVLVLLVGSVLPATPPPRPDGRPATAIATAQAPLHLELPPASVTQVPSLESVPSRPTETTGGVRPALLESSPWSVPDVLLSAYRRAVAGAPPGCHLPVSLLAAIGQVESGSLAGRSIDAAHRAVPPVLGPVLDGVGTAAIPDTDRGRLDGNLRWDRAVGPMQFIPSTWAAFGVDGDGDGRADPQDVYDAAASAAGYLCAQGRDLALASGLQSAILSYNHSTAYLATVLAWQRRFAAVGSGSGHAANGKLNAPTNLAAGAAAIPHGTVRQTPTAVHTSSTAASVPSNDVMIRTAAKLAFSTAPSPTTSSGTALATQPVVTIQDAAGITTSTDTSSVTLTLTTPAGASLTCTSNPTTATSGIASFTGCTIDTAGTYTLTATDGSLTSATSSIVTITAASAAKLAFTTAPSPTTTSGTALATQPVVTIQDAAGNTATTNTSSVTLTLTTPAGASLTCTANPTTATSGIASFTGCAIDTAGTYTLTATDGSLTSTTSTSVTITTAPSPTTPSPTTTSGSAPAAPPTPTP
jgi:hypothetical protein